VTRLALFRSQVEIRLLEKRAYDLFLQNLVKGTSHLSLGQEAVAAGFAVAMRRDDYSFCTYRGHAHTLARGAPMVGILGELMGRKCGLMGGKGGSMHLTSVPHGAMGSYAIVGAHLPVAAGAAWSAQVRGTGQVAVCFFGDGATNIGAFHESLNMSKVFKLPVVWFCINNRYGMGTPVEDASAVADIYKKACAYDMESIQVDGMNLREVMLKTSEIVEKTRADSEPRFIEALCYRFKGHSVVDPDKYRSAEDKEKFRKADPIVAFEHELEKSGLADEEYFKKVRQEIDAEVQEIIRFADESPDPRPEDLYKYVYAGEWENRPELRGDPL